MNRRRILLTIALIVGAVAVLFSTLRREPTADGKTISQWLEILGSSDSAQTELAADAIREIGTNALPQMLWEIRQENSKAKLWIQEQSERQSLIKFTFEDKDKHREHAEAAFEILGETAAPAIPALMEMMEKDSVQFEVQQSLVHIGTLVIDPLIQGLASPKPALRQNAAFALYWHHTPTSAIPALVVCLNDTEAAVRATAAKALAGKAMMADQIIPMLIRLLGDSDRDVRSEAAVALYFYGSRAEEAVEPLLNLVTNLQADIQHQAIRALGGIGWRSEIVVPTLLTNLQTTDIYRRSTVIESLAGFPERAEEIVPALMNQAKQHRRYEITSAVIESLGKLRSKPDIVLPHLVSYLDDPDPYVRLDAVYALADFSDSSEQTIAALKLRLQDDKLFYHGSQKRMLRVSDAAQRTLYRLQSKQTEQTDN